MTARYAACKVVVHLQVIEHYRLVVFLQPAAGPRVKDKFVSLPDELDAAAAQMARQHTLDLPSTVFEVCYGKCMYASCE